MIQWIPELVPQRALPAKRQCARVALTWAIPVPAIARSLRAAQAFVALPRHIQNSKHDSTPIVKPHPVRGVVCCCFSFILTFHSVTNGASASPAVASAQSNENFVKFDDWFHRYKSGFVIFRIGAGRVPANCSMDYLDERGEFPRVLAACASEKSRDAARRLLELASFQFDADPNIELQQFGDRAPDRVRSAALQALGRLDARDALDWLARDVLLESVNTPPEKRATAARALAFSKDKQIRLAVYSAARDPSPVVRGAAIESAVAIGEVRPSAMRNWLDETDPQIRMIALDATARAIGTITEPRDRESLLAPARALLEDADPRVCDLCIEILGNAPARDSISPLIKFMIAERERIARNAGRKRLLLKAGETLQKMTGLDHPAGDPDRWREWWRDSAEKYQLNDQFVARARTAADGLHYFSIPVRTDRMIFLIDTSSSMNEPLARDTGAGAARRKVTKLERAKTELIHVLRGLDARDSFQIISCATTTRAAFDLLVPATRDNKAAAEKFVLALQAEGETALFDGIERALALTTATSRKSGRDGDTVFLLSDGVATTGSAISQNEILRRVQDRNRFVRAEFYSIYIGSEGGEGRGLLENLARENHGEFRGILE